MIIKEATPFGVAFLYIIATFEVPIHIVNGRHTFR